MAKKRKSHFNKMDPSKLNRKVGNRTTRLSATDPKKIVFSFKYFIDSQPKNNEQSYVSWEDEKRLALLLKGLEILNNLSLTEAIQQGLIKEYKKFPPVKSTKFKCPSNFTDRKWYVIKKIFGGVTTVAGLIIDNIFYIVFFDKDHEFWLSPKKHT